MFGSFIKAHVPKVVPVVTAVISAGLFAQSSIKDQTIKACLKNNIENKDKHTALFSGI